MKVRCSAIGKIMTSPRTKGEVLSQTAKTYIQELALETKYGIRKEFNSRYTDKGNLVEDESIRLTEDVLDLGFIYKNDEYFENDYIKGTPDVITDTLIIDVKSSWDGTTFPWFAEELPTKDYFYQLQGYMWLTGKKFSKVVYCLVNTPEDIVLDEIRRASWSKHEIEVSDETENEVRLKHEFNHIPKEKRIKVFEVEYNEEVIEQIKEKVEACREYFNQIISLI